MIAVKTSVKAAYQCWAKQEFVSFGGSRSPRVEKISLDIEWEVRSLFLLRRVGDGFHTKWPLLVQVFHARTRTAWRRTMSTIPSAY